MECKNKELGFIIFFFAAIFVFEYFLREAVYSASVEIQSEISQNYNTSAANFLMTITKAGQKEVLIPIYIILFVSTPLNISLSFKINLIICYYLSNVLKACYHYNRPYFEEVYFPNMNCNSGYGNPSGHSFMSTSLYLGLNKALTSLPYFNTRAYMKIMIGTIVYLLLVLIMFSRFYIGVHSIDQILFGFFLGVGVYLTLFQYLRLHLLNDEQIKLKFLNPGNKILIDYSAIVILLILTLVIYFVVTPDQALVDRLDLICNDISPLRKLNVDALYQSLGLTGLLGIYLGFTILFRKADDSLFKTRDALTKFNSFNRWSSSFRLFMLVLAIFIISYLPYILVTFLFEASITLNLIFDIAFPLLASTLLLHSAALYFSIKQKEADALNNQGQPIKNSG